MTRRLPRAATLALVLAATIGSTACGMSLSGPPVEISTRDSLIGAGKVVQIQNTSNEPLTEIRVTLRSPEGEEREYVEGRLGAYETFEVGWKKLGGWEVRPGSTVEVRAGGHLLAVKGRVADE